MGLTEHMRGTDVAKYAIEAEGNDKLFTFIEMEEKIRNGELLKTTLVYCNEVDSDPRIPAKNGWKPAEQYYDLRKVFEKLIPPPPKK